MRVVDDVGLPIPQRPLVPERTGPLVALLNQEPGRPSEVGRWGVER